MVLYRSWGPEKIRKQVPAATPKNCFYQLAPQALSKPRQGPGGGGKGGMAAPLPSPGAVPEGVAAAKR